MAAGYLNVSAETANKTNVPCKHGHVGHWVKNGFSKGVPTRYCLECKRINMRKYNYGLSQPEYLQMLEQQNYGCAICTKGGKLVVDHCHKTGSVRGLLCNMCNLLLGIMEANTITENFMEKAKTYIEQRRVS